MDWIPKKIKKKSQELVNPIIHLERSKKEDLKSSKYFHHTNHNTPGNSSSRKYVIKIPRLDSCIIFLNLVQKASVGQNVSTAPPMYI